MLWRVAVGPWRRSALLVSRAVAAGVAPPSPLSFAHVRRCPHHLRPTPTTVIPAEAGIQVGFHGNERAVRGVGGHVGHHRWTRGFGVLYRGTDLDPRLRGDDGRRGVQRSAKGGSDRGVACFGVWRWVHGAAPHCSCPALSLPGSPHPRRCRSPMSGAAPTIFAPHPPPSSPRRRGSRLASTGMNGRSGAWAVMSAITGGPGGSAFFIGGRTWIPACAGMTV